MEYLQLTGIQFIYYDNLLLTFILLLSCVYLSSQRYSACVCIGMRMQFYIIVGVKNLM